MNESEYLLTAVRKCQRSDLYSDPRPLAQEEQDQLNAMQSRRVQGEPVQYILGECEFFGLAFKVDRRVLIPRPETEFLVEQVLASAREFPKKDLRILDIGTGSGNIAVTLAKNLPEAQVTAIDVSAEALEVAAENARRHAVEGQIEFVGEDMEDFLSQKSKVKSQKFDLIVSNPPYIPSDLIDYLSLMVRHEPRLALDGGIAGLKFYEPIIAAGTRLLNSGGQVFFEIGDGQSAKLKEIFQQYPEYQNLRFVKDYCGTERVVTASF